MWENFRHGMNLVCPACGSEATSMLRKMSSSPAFPARCRTCGEMLAAQRTFLFLLVESVASHVILIGGALVAYFMWTWWPLLAAILVDLVVAPLLYWQAPLIIVTAEQRFRWRVGAVVGVVVFIGLVIVAGLTDY